MPRCVGAGPTRRAGEQGRVVPLFSHPNVSGGAGRDGDANFTFSRQVRLSLCTCRSAKGSPMSCHEGPP